MSSFTSKKRKKKDIIPLDRVFPPDPYEDLEDTRPVEIRKGKRNKPNRVIPWRVIES